ncbi:MAG TPA: general stress protein [Nocardioidaceae bacterium]|nr:general stress protein [Nocardioidaceae bacterium]
MTVPPGRGRAPSFSLQYPQSLGTYTDYAEAQRVVDFLSDQHFPVENCMIVGTELKQLERITGRLNYGRAALGGAASGAWFGLFIGLLFGIFARSGGWLLVVISAVLLGIGFGCVWGLIGYAMTGGRRDFTSVTQVNPSTYEVLVEHKLLAQAQELLARMPGRPL